MLVERVVTVRGTVPSSVFEQLIRTVHSRVEQ